MRKLTGCLFFLIYHSIFSEEKIDLSENQNLLKEPKFLSDKSLPYSPSLALLDLAPPTQVAFFKASPPTTVPDQRRMAPIVKRMTLSHADGFGAGTDFGTNDSSATMFFAPNYRLGHILPFLDVRVHRFDNNTYGANFGVGGRYIPTENSFCYLLGFNIFYDYRRGHNWNYNQLGLGLEILGKRLDFRANIYFPVGTKKYSKCCVFDEYIGDFIAVNCKCESISYGYNAEVGYLMVRSKTFLLYGATGPYYFAGKCLDRTIGWEFRLRPQYKDYFALDLKVSYDQLYNTVFQSTFIVSVPLYQIATRKHHQGPCGITDRQIYQPIIRQDTIPISRSSCWQTNFDEPQDSDDDTTESVEETNSDDFDDS